MNLFQASLILLSLFTVILAENDEFYCERKADQWQVCRTCNNSTQDCDGTSQSTDGCRCDDIRLAQRPDYDFKGGWENCQTNGWCYIQYRENKVCSDQKWAGETERFTTDRTIKGRPYIWMKQGSEIGKSTEACNGKQYNTGNEAILEGVKITGDRLRNIELDGTLAEELTFYFDTSDDCKEECSSRIGVCGAWSYDNFEGLCYLHTVDSCCGQFGKRETISGFTSGYVCRHCWSTKAKTDCHCSVKQRTQMPGTRHSSGAKQPLHNSATSELSVHEIEIGTDLCACEYRKVGRRGRKRCKCAKPQCKHSFFNPTGKCQDPRRCRTSRRVFNPDKITPC